MVASDKLFFWLFQERTERLLPLVTSLLANTKGYTFSAPVIKEREVRPAPDAGAAATHLLRCHPPTDRRHSPRSRNR
ncbi:MAG: DUF2887 domain-containing protein [Cyanobacteriota bacterium]